MKKTSTHFAALLARRIRFMYVLLTVAAMAFAGTVSALTYNVTSTTDFAYTTINNSTGVITAGAGVGQVTLRSAIQAADATGGGPHIINVPAGTYPIVRGSILFGNVAENISILGAGAATTVIQMTTTLQDRIFFINPPGTVAGVITTLQGLRFTGGKLTSDNYGGGAILAGGPTNTLTVTSCTFDNNTIDVAAGTTGGAINMSGGGALNIDQCTFTNNSNPVSDGGAVYYFFQNFAGLTGSMSVTNSTFTNNTSTTGNGGAIGIALQGRIAPFDQTFTASIQKNTFTGNSAPAGSGGAIIVNNGSNTYPININYNRIVTNTAASATSTGLGMNANGVNGGNVNATNNWWGCNLGPVVAGGCNKAAIVGGASVGTLDVTSWIVLTNKATTSPICPSTYGLGNTSLVTASFLTNNLGAAISTANLTTLIGQPINFNTPVLGTISGAQTTIQANGTATATFTSNGTPGNGSINATFNSAAENFSIATTPPIVINAPAGITTQPSNTNLCGPTNTATFTVVGSGTATLSYQWYKGATPLANGALGSATVSGATMATLTITNATTANNGTDYYVIVSNSCGTATSNNVSLTITLPPTTSNAGPDQTACAAPGSATMAGNTPTVGTGTWTQISGPVTAAITTPGDPVTTITGMTTAGTYVYQWTIANAPCTASSDQISVVVSGAPTTANAGVDKTICTTSGSSTMTGNTATVGTGTWTQISGPVTAVITTPGSPTTTITGMTTAGTYVFQWSIANAPCTPSADQVSVIVNAPPTTSNAGPDLTACTSAGSATMAGNTATVGTGTWTQISGPVTAVITTPGSPTTTITGMTTAGTYVFQWTIANAPCTASSDQISVVVSGAPTTANAGVDKTICSTSGSSTMTGNTATVGTGTWTQISGPVTAVITTPGSPTTTITGMTTAGTYVFQWSIANAPCTPSTDQVSVIVNAPPTTANAGPDQPICATSATMAGNTPTIGTGTWTQISGPVTATITTPGDPVTTITGMTAAGTYVYQWTIANAPCTASSDQISVIVSGAPTTANAGPDQTRCITPGSATMAGNTATVGTGAWTQISGPVTAVITTPASPTTTITGMTTAGTYVFQWTISNSPCAATSDQVSIVINTAPVVSNPANTTGQLGVPFSETFTQAGGSGTVTFTTASTLPTGLTLSSAGVLSGTPTQTGTFPIVVTASNGCTASGPTYTLVINACPVITVTNPATTTGTAGTAFSQTFTSAGGAAGTITYTTASTLPAGLTLATNGTLSGTPTQTGTFPIVVTATDINSCSGNGPTYNLVISCPAPVTGTATPSSQASCSGSAITTIVLAGAPSGATYNWTRDNTGTAPGIAASGSGDISGIMTNAGTAPVLVTFTITPSYYSGCTGTPYTATVTVNPVAAVTQVAPQTICAGGSSTAINFSSTATGGTIVYNWTGTDGTIGLATSGSGNIPSFTATNTGTAVVTDTIKVTASYTNGSATCAGPVMLFVITVNPTPAVNTVTGQTVCNGAPVAAVTYSGAVAGTVYSWTNNNTATGLGASGTGNIASFTGTNATGAPITSTVTVTPTFYNQSIMGSIVTGDLTMPNRLFRDGIGSACPGKAFPGTSAGAHLYDTYSFVNTTGQAQCVTITYNAKSTGDIFVTAYNGSFNPASLATNYMGDGGLSSIGGSVSTFGVTVAAGATLVLVANEANSAPCPVYVLSVSGIGMACTGTPKTFNITVNPTPTVNTVTNQTICNGAPSTAVTFSGAAAGTVYNWTNNDASIGLAASGTGDIASFTATNSGTAPVTATITVTPSYTNNGTTCTGTPTTFTITVNPTATVNTVADQVICNGSSTTAVTFSSPATGGTIVYNWTNNTPSIGLAGSGTGNIASFVATNATASPITATITVTPSYTNGTTCTGTPTTFTITVTPTPTVTCPANISVNATAGVCNAVVTYTATSTGTVSYVFTGATLGSGSGNGSGSTFNVGVTTVTLTASSASCVTTSSCSFTVTVVDVEPPVITCPAQIVVCGSQVVNYPLPTVTDNCGSAAVPLNLTQTASNTITPSNSVSCNNGAGHTANSYYRVYDLAALALTGPYTVNKIVWGIESANAPSGSQPVTIKVHTLTGAFTLANLTQVASESLVITNQAGTVITTTLTTPPTVAANAKLVLEVFTPDGRPTSSLFYMGSNTGAETAPGYISAPDCGVTNPIPVSSVGYPNMRMVLSTEGTVGGAPIVPVQTAGLPSGSTFPVGTTVNTYTATDAAGNTSSCSFNVVVNPIPSVNAIANVAVCNGATTTAIPVTGPVSGTVYSWTNSNTAIGLAASGTGDIPSYTATNAGTAPISGTITITPSYTNAGLTCTGTPITFTITVNPTATVNAVANQVVCNGAPTTAVTFSSPTTGGTIVYNWTNNTTSIGLAASGTGNIASFTATNATNAPITATITVTPSYTNGTTCTGTPITFTITVNPTATVNAVANQVVCNNAPTTAVTFSGFVPGTVYSWTNNTTSIGLAASGTGNIASFTATNTTNAPVTATITVTPSYTNGAVTCTGTPTTFTITVNPTPTVNAVANQVVCNNAPTTAVTFSGFVPGTVYSWTNNTTSIGLAASGTGNIASFTATNTTNAPVTATITVTPSYTNGSTTCTGTPTTFTITVNPTATVNAVANQVVCNNAPTTAVTFSGFVPGTVYSWTNNTTSIGLAASGTGNIASFTATNTTNAPVTATITVTPSYTNGAVTCTGTPITFTITVNPTATVNAVANQVVCNASPTTAVTFSSPTTGGTIVYNWTNNTAAIGLAASGTGNIASFTATNSTTAPLVATITVTPSYTNGSVTCVGTPITFTITVNPVATIDPVANQVVCNNSPTAAVTFISPTTGGTIVNNWTNNNTAIGLAASGTGNIASFTATNTTTGPLTATITVTPSYTNGAVTCVGTPRTFTITVNPVATVNAVPNQVVCNNSPTAAINFTSPTTGGTIVYNWTNSDPSIGLAPSGSGSGNIPSFNATNATNAPVTATITVTPSYTNGSVTCVGTPRTFTITVNPTATVNAVANQVVCNASPTTAVTFSSPTTGGTIVYNWTNSTPAIGLAASGTGNIASFTATNTTTGPLVATITVTPSYTNGAVTCVGTPRTFTITVNPVATVTAVPNQVVCNNSPTTAVTFTSPTTGGTIVYNWTNNTTSIGLAASGTGNIASFNATNTTTGPVTATITVTPSYTNGSVTCVGTARTFTITVNPTATVNAVTNQVVCNNSPTAAVTFSSPTTGGTIVYNWTNNTPAIGLAASGTGNIPSFTGTNTTTAPLVATITITPSYTNGAVTCVGTPRTFTITVNPVATINTVANQVVCHNSPTTAVTFTSPTTGGTIVYNWTNNNTTIGLGASGTGNIPSFTAINTTTAPVTATITVTPSYTNGAVTCVGTPITFTITVNTLSQPPTGATTSQALICGSGSVTLSAQGGFLGTGASYKWYAGSCGGTFVGTGQTLTNVPVTGTTTFFVRIEGTCNTTACVSVTVTVAPQPVVVITATPSLANTPGTPVIITATVSPAGSYTFVWKRNGVVVPGATGNVLNISSDASGTYTATATSVTTGCTALSNSVVVFDKPTGILFVTPNPNNGIFNVSYFATPQEIGTSRKLVIYDNKGSRIFEKTYPVTLPYNIMHVDVRGHAKGLYYIALMNASGQIIASSKVLIFE